MKVARALDSHFSVVVSMTDRDLEALLKYLFAAALAEGITSLDEMPLETKAKMVMDLLGNMPYSAEVEHFRQMVKDFKVTVIEATDERG